MNFLNALTARVFWIIVVVVSFILSGVIIHQSFNAWNESPVRTTIETRPIDEIKFPKVTVCPPKNTYTNLNYDLGKMGDMKVDVDTYGWKILKDYVQFSQNEDAEQHWEQYFRGYERNMLQNWYHDFSRTSIKLPDSTDLWKNYQYFSYNVETFTTKGKIVSPHFKSNEFDANNFSLSSFVVVSLGNTFFDFDEIDENKTKVYYKIKITYDIEKNKEKISISTFGAKNRHFSLNETQQFHEINISSQKQVPFILNFRRRFLDAEFRVWKKKRYTGFALEWEYFTIDQENERERSSFPPCGDDCKIFKHFANLLHEQTTSPEELKKTVKDVMSDWILGYVDEVYICSHNCKTRQTLLAVVYKRLGLEKPTLTPKTKYNITDENLLLAGKLMTLMLSSDTGKWQEEDLDDLENRLDKYSLRQIIQSLNLKSEDPGKKLILDRIVREYNLEVMSMTEQINGIHELGKLLEKLLINFLGFADTMTKNIFDITNHPVHIVDLDKNTSPSSFIPFCEFGGNMSALGTKIEQLSVPVCNSFKARVLNDQLCYEVDLNKIISRPLTTKDLKLGLALLIDENKERQYNLTSIVNGELRDGDLSIAKKQNEDTFSIHISSIG